MNIPFAPESRRMRASMILFSFVVLHVMGVLMNIDCFPISATNTVEIVSDADIGTDCSPKNPAPWLYHPSISPSPLGPYLLLSCESLLKQWWQSS